MSEYITNLTGLETEYFVCAFYALEKDEVFQGLKKEFNEENILTGRQFCEMLDINYEEVMEKALSDQPDNLNYLLLKADEIKEEENADPKRYFEDKNNQRSYL